ncbi:hypothetical protein F5887DRAFT_1108277 [Amanita rubescens]|nr:hypothetical protein F5887DRAFT_1108277 [Amanita rubescens]
MLRYASSESEDARKAERYVAAAIVSCRGDLDRYLRLANTWFGLFLWPFRQNEKYTAQYFSENATPTIEETASHAEIHERTPRMKDAVIARDDYKCVVSGFFDYDKYKGRGLNVAFLQCAHILKRAVGVRAARADHESVSLFDILIHLFPRAASRLRDLGDKLDAPGNGIMLSSEIHLAFDHFVFCLMPWPKENPDPDTYKIVRLSWDKIPGLEESIVKFEDHSHKHRAPLQPHPAHNYHLRSGQQEPSITPSGVDLPDPEFIAIHAAVTNIMHMSGAAGFIDYVLRRWSDEFPKLKVPKADELEDLNYLASAFAAADLTPGMGSISI